MPASCRRLEEVVNGRPTSTFPQHLFVGDVGCVSHWLLGARVVHSVHANVVIHVSRRDTGQIRQGTGDPRQATSCRRNILTGIFVSGVARNNRKIHNTLWLRVAEGGGAGYN